MAGTVPGTKPDPADALLRRLNRVEAQVVAHGQREAAHLADGLGDALEELRTVLDQPPRAMDAARLLIGEEEHDDVATGPDAAPPPGTDHGEDHRVHVLHVDRASAPHESAVEQRLERRVRPVLGHGRDDVDVPVQQQCARGRVGAGDPQVDAAPRVARGREDLGIEADLAQALGAVVGDLGLADRLRGVAPVAGVDADELLGQLDDLRLRVGKGLPLTRIRCRRHGHILPLTWHRRSTLGAN